MTEHIGELAALYALGALDEGERIVVETHIRRCEPCARLLAQAEADVTTIAAALPQHAVPPQLAGRIAAITAHSGPVTPARWVAPLGSVTRWVGAFAAALLLMALPLGYVIRQNLAMHEAMVAQNDAIARISTSAHRNVAFTGMSEPSRSMAAHVMYGPDGSWYCVIVRGVTHPLQIVWPHDGERTMLGTAMPHGDVALLYLPKSHRMDELALMDGSRIVASAQLAFQ